MIVKLIDKVTMRDCRLINKDWKKAVDYRLCLEKTIFSNWMTWGITRIIDRDLFPLMPTACSVKGIVQMEETGYEVWSENFVLRHAALRKSAFENDYYSPFPNKSLCISQGKPEQCEWYQERKNYADQDRVEMDTFLIQHGHHLFSLVLQKTAMTPTQLLKIVGHLPNLKALTVDQMEIGCSSATAKKFFKEHPIDANVLPKLTHLRVLNCEPAVTHCLVSFCATRVVRLELNGYTISLFLPGDAAAFGVLEHWIFSSTQDSFQA